MLMLVVHRILCYPLCQVSELSEYTDLYSLDYLRPHYPCVTKESNHVIMNVSNLGGSLLSYLKKNRPDILHPGEPSSDVSFPSFLWL